MTVTDDVGTLAKLDFERRALGIALRSPSAADTLVASLSRDDIYGMDHRAIFDAIQARVLASLPLDLALIVDDLANLPPGAATGNITNLPFLLWDEAGSEAGLPEYVKGIRAASHARQLVALSIDLRRQALETDGREDAVGAALLEADRRILEMTEEITDVQWLSIADVASGVEAGESQLDPLFKTGLTDLDAKLNGGPRAGQVIVIAGRPGMGKSTLALDIARHAAFRTKDCPGLHISLEMNADEIGARLIAAEASVPLNAIVQNTLSDVDRDQVESRIEQLHRAKAPLYVADSVEPTLPSVVGLIRAAHRRLGIKFVTVDYLQLLTSDGNGTTDRQQTVANISRDLKALARTLGITVFLVAQLNRGSENRSDKRPQVSDLRESGQIEQDADIVILVHRDEVYDPQTERGGEADLIVGKHRGGPTGVVVTLFQGHFSRFVSAAHTAYEDSDPGLGE